MNTQKVKFHSVEEIQQFVKAIKNCPHDIDIQYGSYIIDAKSIMGILSLGINKTVNMKINGELEEDLLDEISYCRVS